MKNNSKKYMKMKQIMIWMILAVGLLVGACHQTTVGYLLTENAPYDPDTMYIRKTLDPELDAVRIENKAPWVSLALQGYEGTQQILFSVESVTLNRERRRGDFQERLDNPWRRSFAVPVRE